MGRVFMQNFYSVFDLSTLEDASKDYLQIGLHIPLAPPPPPPVVEPPVDPGMNETDKNKEN